MTDKSMLVQMENVSSWFLVVARCQNLKNTTSWEVTAVLARCYDGMSLWHHNRNAFVSTNSNQWLKPKVDLLSGGSLGECQGRPLWAKISLFSFSFQKKLVKYEVGASPQGLAHSPPGLATVSQNCQGIFPKKCGSILSITMLTLTSQQNQNQLGHNFSTEYHIYIPSLCVYVCVPKHYKSQKYFNKTTKLYSVQLSLPAEMEQFWKWIKFVMVKTTVRRCTTYIMLKMKNLVSVPVQVRSQDQIYILSLSFKKVQQKVKLPPVGIDVDIWLSHLYKLMLHWFEEIVKWCKNKHCVSPSPQFNQA